MLQLSFAIWCHAMMICWYDKKLSLSRIPYFYNENSLMLPLPLSTLCMPTPTFFSSSSGLWRSKTFLIGLNILQLHEAGNGRIHRLWFLNAPCPGGALEGHHLTRTDVFCLEWWLLFHWTYFQKSLSDPFVQKNGGMFFYMYCKDRMEIMEVQLLNFIFKLAHNWPWSLHGSV